jgi:para-nitrobenzyl esterase
MTLTPPVLTSSGPVLGQAGPVARFLGIPYAAAPVGPLRWTAPRPHPGWTDPLQCTAFGPDSAQAGPQSASPRGHGEDCLYLNVWSPGLGHHERRPVMVWIHGGGFIGGSGATPRTEGSWLASRGAVVVTLNYRLGALGFLAHPGLSRESAEGVSGNFGLQDQLAALRWVRDNIAEFGGDPDNVTLVGVSAGGACISLLMASPAATGLFHKVILQSPGAMRPLATLAQAEAVATAVYGDDVDALRRLPVEEVLARQAQLDGAGRSVLSARLLWPICDGQLVPQQEIEVLATGRFPGLPMIIGNHADEGRFFAAGLGRGATRAAYEAAIAQDFGPHAAAVLASYPALSDEQARASYQALFGELQFCLGVREVARANARAGAPTRRYLLETTEPTGAPSSHTDEVAHVFGNAKGEDGRISELGAILAERWLAFATDGSAGPDWPALRPGREPVLRVHARDGHLETEIIDGWRNRGLDVCLQALE